MKIQIHSNVDIRWNS